MSRRLRLLEAMTAGEGDVDPRRVCEVSAQATGASGAGIMLMSDDAPQGSVYATDEVSALIEELQFSLGEGPCIDATAERRPVLEPDLARPARARWLAFTAAVVDAGGRAVFAFPLQIGAISIGVLDLYRDRPGPMSDDQHADALVLADIATRTLLLLQADAPTGAVAPGLDRDGNLEWVVHQATGMVSAQLDIPVGQAFVRLRAYAYGNEQPLRAVAEEIVARRLRLERDDGGEQP